MNHINTPHVSDFESLIQEMNETLFTSEMEDLVELTYSYATLDDGKMVNKTLFWKFLWSEYQSVSWETQEEKKSHEKIFWQNTAQNLNQVLLQAKAKLLKKKSIVIKYKQLLAPYLTEKNSRAQILMGTLEFISKIIDIVFTWLPFEAEKAGLPHNMTQEEILKTVETLEKIEAELFWWNVRENVYEVQGSYELLEQLFSKNSHYLDDQEQKQFQKYLSLLLKKFPEIRIAWIDGNKNTPKIENNTFLNKDISRSDYVEIFKLVFSLYDIHKPVIIEERSSIYDGVDALCIPDTPAYTTLKLKRVLALIQHEIETHYIIEQNNTKTLGKFRGAKNLQREEWLAMISESLLLWKTLDDVKVWLQIPDILMGEILDGQDYETFMMLLGKLKQEKNAKWNYHRRKRNYPLYARWVQHKDTSYNRGQHKVVEYLKNGWDVKDLYLWKISFEDIALVKKSTEIKNIKLLYPILIWEMLQYILSGKRFVQKEFFAYIEQKYPFLDINNELWNRSIEKITQDTKICIVWILEILHWEEVHSVYPRMLKKFHQRNQ